MSETKCIQMRKHVYNARARCSKESEKTLEARIRRETEVRGGIALKYTSQYHRGMPDRILLLPGGSILFVEVKTTGCKPTKLQLRAHEQLRALGFTVGVVDSTIGVDALCDAMDDLIALNEENEV